MSSKPTIDETKSKSISKDLFYPKIILKENNLDTFSIPFRQENILSSLQKHYNPYSVIETEGESDGTIFTCIAISKNELFPSVYLNFDSENKLKLEEIRVSDTTVTDQYGIRIGDSYQTLLNKRKGDFMNFTDYHQHTYLYQEGSNIHYELIGDYKITSEMIENISELELNERQLEKCKVASIVWKK